MNEWSNLRVLGLACALLISPVMAVWNGWSYILLTRDGVDATAVVTGKTLQYSRHSTSYIVEYGFRDANGKRWSGSQSIPHDQYLRLRIGQRLEVVYCRSDPDVSVASLAVLRERVKFMSFASFVIGLIVGALSWWWHYAQAKTREHDAGQRHMRPA